MAKQQPETPPRRVEYRPLAELVPATRNPKAHDLKGIRRSIATLGVADVVGVVDDRTGRLIAGHGRVEALSDMEKAGDAAPDGIVVDDGRWCVPVLVGWASANDLEADTAIIGLNQHTMAGGWDRDMLDEMLLDLRAHDMDPITLGFTAWPKHLDYASDESGDGSARLDDQVFNVLVTCADEMQQRALLERLDAEGFTVTALFM